MHLRTLALFVTLLSVGSAHAFSAEWERVCDLQAQTDCRYGSGPVYDVKKSKCLSDFWQGLTTNDQCPHPDAGCRCYNGCVQDRSDRATDVGGWCVNACRLAQKRSQC
ncbi:hypothetical protein V8E36_006784 [Tilletia maclaganii]